MAVVKILFVCTGNICRSPTAEGVFRHQAKLAGLEDRLSIDSAGTHGYHIGDPPDRRSIAAARRRGIDLSTLRARRVIRQDFEKFDYVIALDRGHFDLLHADCPVLFWPRLESALQDRYKRTSAACQWSRDRLRQMDRTGILGVRAVVAGHTPVPTPLALGNVYHIDTEGWNEGYFTFLDLESLRAWPREVVTDPAPAS